MKKNLTYTFITYLILLYFKLYEKLKYKSKLDIKEN